MLKQFQDKGTSRIMSDLEIDEQIIQYLGYFGESSENPALNSWVLCIHHDFKDFGCLWHRKCNSVDVASIKETFTKRNCVVRDLASARKRVILEHLQSRERLFQLFDAPAQTDLKHTNPDAIWVFLLTHGSGNGTVYTDHLVDPMPEELVNAPKEQQMESYNVSEIWDALKLLNLDCLFVLLLGSCRSSSINCAGEAAAYRLQNGPNIANFVIFYSTLESLVAMRDEENGTIMVQEICKELNEMSVDVRLERFFTRVMWRIKEDVNEKQCNFVQIPELKSFPSPQFTIYRNFSDSNLSQRYDIYQWESFKSSRGRALFFGNAPSDELKNALGNLGFDVTNDVENLKKTLASVAGRSSDDSLVVCINSQIITDTHDELFLNATNEQIPIRKVVDLLTHSVAYAGKPKLFFFFSPDTSKSDILLDLKRCIGKDYVGIYVVVATSAGSVRSVIDALRNHDLRYGESVLQELIASALQNHTAQVEIMPQITSLMPWSLNFAEQNNDVKPITKSGYLKKKVVKVDHINNDKTFNTDFTHYSVFFVTSYDNGPARDRVLSRIAQDFVPTHYDHALVEIDIGVHMGDLFKIVASDTLSDILTIVTDATSFHKEDEILSKISANKAVIFVKGMRFSTPNEISVIEMILRIISKVRVPLFISTVNKFLDYTLEKVRLNRADGKMHIVELSPPNKPQICQVLRFKLKLNRKECDELLVKGGFEMVHGNCYGHSNFPVLCDLLDSKNGEVPTRNIFLLYETYTARLVTKFTSDDEKTDPETIFYLVVKRALQIFGFKNETMSPEEQDLLLRTGFTFRTKTGELKFHHELHADYLIAQMVILCTDAKGLQHKPSTQEVLTERRFFQVRKFLDSYLAQDKQKDVTYTKCCTTLKSAVKDDAVTDVLMENICDEGLFHLYQCLRIFPSKDNISSRLRQAIKSDAQLARALVKDGADFGALLDTYPDSGILHELATNGACDLMMQALKHYAGDPEQPERIADWRLVKRLLNENEIMGCTPLHLAAERGHVEMVTLLIEHSASVTQVDNDNNNWTALHYAVLNGHREATEAILGTLSSKMLVASDPVLELLLEKGTVSIASFQDDMAQQQLVSIREYEDLLFFIVKNNRDQVLHDFLRGRNAAFVAVEKRRPDILGTLAKCGIDLSERDREGWTTLHIAATLGAHELIPLLSKVPVDAQNNRDQTALHIAVKRNNVEFVRGLLDSRNADTSLEDSLGRTPLTLALEKGFVEIAELLQEKAEKAMTESPYNQLIIASVDQATKCKNLHKAAKEGNCVLAQLLIKSGTDPNCKIDESTEGQTAIHHAASSGSDAIVKLLISSGADVKAETKNEKMRAIHIAAQNGHLKCIELLLDSEMEPSRTQSMHQALLLAAGTGQLEVVSGLLRMGADPASIHYYTDNNTPLFASISAKSVECVTEILNNLGEKAISLTSKTLHAAVMINDAKMLQCLIEFGADVNERDDSGFTPICLAASEGYSLCVNVLLNKNPDLHSQNNRGKIPVDYSHLVNVDVAEQLAKMTTESA